MKKIFAIALALVMVLSMASAFASQCTAGFDWTVADVNKCGQAKVEVVPYVKVADGCGSFSWKVSECAGFVPTEDVFFALKLTVDANVDPEWLAAAVFTEDATNLDVEDITFPSDELATADMDDFDSDKQEVYYWDFESAWVKLEKGGLTMDDVESNEATNTYIAAAEATGKPVKLCVTLASTGEDFVAGVVGKYYVVVAKEEDEIIAIAVFASEDDALAAEPTPIVTYLVEDGKVSAQIKGEETCAPYTVADVEAFLGLDNGVKVNQDLVNANFAWDDEQEDCFEWAATSAIVDAECVVAIPKTGDASVLAWLF